MTLYLLHQTANGDPIGVFTEDDYYYDPQQATREQQAYGLSVIGSRGSQQTWAEFADQQAAKTPSPTAMWDQVDYPSAPLPAVLAQAQRTTSIY